MTKKREMRIRVEQAVLDKLKEFKKEIDAPSYNSALRTALGMKEPVAEKAIAKIRENIERERKQKGKPWISKEALLKVVKNKKEK